MSVTETEEKNRGGRPKVIETDEFKAAVAAAVAPAVQAEMAKLAEKLNAARQSAGTLPDGSDINVIRTLAMAIAELNDQGSGRRRVAPEILAKRAAARDLMGELLMQARATKSKPEYKIIAQTQLIDPKTGPRIIQPFKIGNDKRTVQTEIYYYGVPNEAMRPLNDAAKGIYGAFMDAIGGNTDKIRDGEFKADNRPIWVTQNGLVVKGEASGQRRTVSNFGDPIEDEIGTEPNSDDIIEEKPLNDPTREFVPVLGTVAAPARQGASK